MAFGVDVKHVGARFGEGPEGVIVGAGSDLIDVGVGVVGAPDDIRRAILDMEDKEIAPAIASSVACPGSRMASNSYWILTPSPLLGIAGSVAPVIELQEAGGKAQAEGGVEGISPGRGPLLFLLLASGDNPHIGRGRPGSVILQRAQEVVLRAVVISRAARGHPPLERHDGIDGRGTCLRCLLKFCGRNMDDGVPDVDVGGGAGGCGTSLHR